MPTDPSLVSAHDALTGDLLWRYFSIPAPGEFGSETWPTFQPSDPRPHRAANPDLREEHLWGVEGGLDIHPTRSFLVRLNGFYNSLTDLVANVTLRVADEGIFRQLTRR